MSRCAWYQYLLIQSKYLWYYVLRYLRLLNFILNENHMKLWLTASAHIDIKLKAFSSYGLMNHLSRVRTHNTLFVALCRWKIRLEWCVNLSCCRVLQLICDLIINCAYLHNKHSWCIYAILCIVTDVRTNEAACVKLQQPGAVQTIHKNAQEFGFVPSFFLLKIRRNQLGTGSKVDQPKLYSYVSIGHGCS